MRIRCTQCRKKISVDDAFAGGICRCPYCTAIVSVGGKADNSSVGKRPQAPTVRPEFPTQAGMEGQPAPEAYIPLAKPVQFQGIFAMVLIGILALTIVAAGVLVVVILVSNNGNGDCAPDKLPNNPFAVSPAAAVLGNVRINPSVIYVVDTSANMARVFDYASGIILASARSLTNPHEFSIRLCGEKSDRYLSGGYLLAGSDSTESAKEFLKSGRCHGAANIARGMRAALAKDPNTIVLLCRTDAEALKGLAKKITDQGVAIVIVALDASKGECKSLAKFAESVAGQSHAYTRGRLAYWYAYKPEE